MAELLMIVPTRGRPRSAAVMAEAWERTRSQVGCSDLLFAIDVDDPKQSEYIAVFVEYPEVLVEVGPRLRLGPTLNAVASRHADVYPFIGFTGDDQPFSSVGWDLDFVSNLRELGTGFVYPNDLWRSEQERLPTAVAMTSDIVRTLGYMVPLGLLHMAIDLSWQRWGEAIDRFRYLPDTVLEHMHQSLNKSVFDTTYAESDSQMAPDTIRWEEYCSNGELERDLEKLRSLL